jgi:UDP-N-acetylmuramoyl-tripeptide--D-alanyl-D-alanine ligase
MSVHLCSEQSEAMKLIPQISAGDVILVKASRSEHLEELADSILEKGVTT